MRGGASRMRSVRVYDFRRPDKFSKEQIRTLQMVHESFARTLTTSFSAQLRVLGEVAVTDVQQLSYSEFLAGVGEPAVLAIITLAPLKGNAVLDLDYRIVFPMIDRLFGGPGQAVPVPRPLTDIERTVVQRVVRTMFDALQEAWSNVVALKPALLSIESNRMFAQVVAPGEMCANIVLGVSFGPHQGTIQICLPYLTLEPILPRLATHRWFVSEGHGDGDRSRPAALELERVLVDVWARLGTTTITLGELLRLRRGGVLRLDRHRDDDIEVFVADKPKFRAQPGRRGKSLAVRIRGILDEDLGGDEA